MISDERVRLLNFRLGRYIFKAFRSKRGLWKNSTIDHVENHLVSILWVDHRTTTGIQFTLLWLVILIGWKACKAKES